MDSLSGSVDIQAIFSKYDRADAASASMRSNPATRMSRPRVGGRQRTRDAIAAFDGFRAGDEQAGSRVLPLIGGGYAAGRNAGRLETCVLRVGRGAVKGNFQNLSFDIFCWFLFLRSVRLASGGRHAEKERVRTMMRILFGAVAATFLISTAAFAAQTEGLIKKIDKETLTITLDDGKSYKMNAETDIDSLKEGMDIVIAYDVANGENVVTDMELPE
jgi:Cu/Ag efflux protein CusF